MTHSKKDLRSHGESPKDLERASAIARAIRQALPQQHYAKALEFGCGTGLIGFQLRSLFDHLIFADKSADKLAVVRDKIDGLGCTCRAEGDRTVCSCEDIPTLETALWDLEGPFRPELKSDLIFLSMALHHVKDLKTSLDLFAEYLTPGGTLCIVDMNSMSPLFHKNFPEPIRYHGFDRAELSAELEKAGFTILSYETFYEGTKMTDGEPIPYTMFCMAAVKK